MPNAPLSSTLPGTWRLLSRLDVTAAGAWHDDPLLGSDPVAWLVYDRAGHFAAQFMKRDQRDAVAAPLAAGANNTRAIGGYDADFGTYSVDDATGLVTQTPVGSLPAANVGMTLTRGMTVDGAGS